MTERFIHSLDVVVLMQRRVAEFSADVRSRSNFRILGKDCRVVLYEGVRYAVDDRRAEVGAVFGQGDE